MGKQKDQKFVGRIGNVIYYQRNGGFYTRSVPSRMPQTKATKKASSNFGVASQVSRVLRNLLEAAIPFPKDKKMQNRYRGAVMKWLQQKAILQLEPAINLPYIQDFQFNEASSLQELWKVSLSVNQPGGDVLELLIPAFIPKEKISAPAWTNRVECTVVAASCSLQNIVTNAKDTHSFSIRYNEEPIAAQNIRFTVDMRAGSLVVVAVSLTYFVSKNRGQVPTDKIAFMPSGIVAAMYV